MKVTTVELPIYDIDLVVIVDSSFEPANKKFKLELEDEWLTAHALTYCDYEKEKKVHEKSEIYLLIKDYDFSYNTVSHELFHIISVICELRDISMDKGNDEPLAYLQGYVGEKILTFRDKYLEEKKKALPL